MLCDDDRNGNHEIYLSLANKKQKKNKLKFKMLGKVKEKWCRYDGARTTYADINGDGRADMLCDNHNGEHWALLGNGIGYFEDPVKGKGLWRDTIMHRFCYNNGGKKTSWADITGNGVADMLCDDKGGSHWYYMNKKPIVYDGTL